MEHSRGLCWAWWMMLLMFGALIVATITEAAKLICWWCKAFIKAFAKGDDWQKDGCV